MRLVCHLVIEMCQEYDKSVFVRKLIVMTIILVDMYKNKSHIGSLKCM